MKMRRIRSENFYRLLFLQSCKLGEIYFQSSIHQMENYHLTSGILYCLYKFLSLREMAYFEKRPLF